MNSEAIIHRAVVHLLRGHARPDVIWFHVPNGEHRNPVVGAKLKAMGVRAGVSDFVFVLPGGRAAFLEIKRGNGRLSPVQRLFADACEAVGAPFKVAHDIASAVEILNRWAVFQKPISTTTAAAADREGRGRPVAFNARGPAPQSNTRALGVPA